MGRRAGFTLIEMLVAIAIMAIIVALAVPAVQSMRDTARRSQCQDHLRQLGFALHQYHDVFATFPAGTVNATGPIINTAAGYHHNWLVGLLPYLDQPLLAEELDPRVSIYAQPNRTVLNWSLPLLKCPSDDTLWHGRSGAGLSSYAGCHNSQGAGIDVDNDGVLILNRPVSRDDIRDGTCCTLMVGEIPRDADDLGWASGTRASLRNTGTGLNRTDDGLQHAPITLSEGDYSSSQQAWNRAGSGSMAMGMESGEAEISAVQRRPETPELPWRFAIQSGGFGSLHDGACQFLLSDGRVRLLSDSLSLDVLQRLGGRADGNWVGPDQF